MTAMPTFSSPPSREAVCRWCLTVIETTLACDHDDRPNP